MNIKNPKNSRFRTALLIFAAVASISCADETEFNRGPYLQNPSSTTMIVKWRNDRDSLGQVSYGTSPGELNERVEKESDSFTHEILLENLQPDTRYYYRTNGVKDNEFSFKTPPVEGEPRATRVWILGDAGTADDGARKVRDAFYSFNQSAATDMMIMLGDNAYDSGSDSDYQAAFFEIYPETLTDTPVWSTIGNHDIKADGGAPYFNIFSLPTDGKTGGVPSGTEAYYSFNYANIHFVSLDSEVSDRSPTGAMYNWLLADLSANTQDWAVVFFHQPPYSKGTHDSDGANTSMSDMRENFTALFESFGVDLVFSGHSHNYERSYPIIGHRGTANTFQQSMKTDTGNGRIDGDGEYQKTYAAIDDGIIYTVAGSAGKTRSAPLNHPVHFVAMSELGSVVLDFDGDRLDVTFVSPNPNAIDYYTVTKSL